MPFLDVVGVRAVVERLAVARECDGRRALDEAVGRRQRDRLGLRRRNAQRVDAIPLVHRRRHRDEQVVVRPRDVADRREQAVVRLRAPQLARRASVGQRRALADVRDHDLKPVTAGERVIHEAGCVDHTRSVALLAATPAPAPATATATATAKTARAHRAAAAAAASSGRPRRIADAATALLSLAAERHARSAQESDALAVRRPCRRTVAIHAGRHVRHGARLHIIDCNEGMVLTIGDERDLGSIRRPTRVGLASPHFDEGFLAALHRVGGNRIHDARRVDLSFLCIEDAAPVGGEDRIGRGRDFPWGAPCARLVHAHRPHIALTAFRIVVGARDPSVTIGSVAADEHDCLAVVGDADVGQVNGIVLVPARELRRLEGRRACDVDVASAEFVGHPCHAVRLFRRHQRER